MTNREKIEKMTVKEFVAKEDNELERFLLNLNSSCNYCSYQNMTKRCDAIFSCPMGIRKWLDQEVKVET